MADGARRARTRYSSPEIDPADESRASVPRDLERFARFLDSSIKLPGNVRIGADGLIGLIPGIGDAAGAIFGAYILARASALGMPKAVLARMFMNVAIDTLIGAVPVLGDIFDLAFKSNWRNIELMRRYLADAKHERRVSAWLVAGVIALIAAITVLVIALAILLARAIASTF